MREQHLNLFAFVARCLVGLRLSCRPGEVAGIFVRLARNSPEVHVRAASVFGRAGLTGGLQRPVLVGSARLLYPVRVGVVAAEPAQRIPLWADVLVVLFIPLEA